jgi:hypothetical protein
VTTRTTYDSQSQRGEDLLTNQVTTREVLLTTQVTTLDDIFTTDVTTRDDILTTLHDDQKMTENQVTSTDDIRRHQTTASGDFYRQSQKLPVLPGVPNKSPLYRIMPAGTP